MFQKLYRLTLGRSTISRSFLDKRRDVHCRKIVFSEFGDPIKVTSLVEETLSDKPPDEEVIVKMIIAPVNHADINVIQGVYPVKPQLPNTLGSEGIGEVLAVGSAVKNLVPGDRVIFSGIGINGTWCTAGIFHSTQLKKVRKDIDDTYALSGIIGNSCTAYRMLHDFVALNKGDVIIQNGANSACGQNIIQLARVFGYQTVNIIRNRPEPDLKNLKKYLKSLGATFVLAEEELRSTSIFKKGFLPKPRLGFNNIGGKSATEVLHTLDNGGIMVTYGGMSKQPVTVSTSSLIFKDIQLRGFLMSRWCKENASTQQFQKMFDDVSQFMKDGELIAPAYKVLPLSSFQETLENTISPKGFVGYKYFLDLQ